MSAMRNPAILSASTSPTPRRRRTGRARAASPARGGPSIFDACQIGVVLRTVVFVEAVVAIAALFVVSTPGEWLVQTATITGGALPATLLWLVSACGLKKPLRRLPKHWQYTAGALLGALSALYGCGLLRLTGALSNAPWLASALTGALFAGLVMAAMVLRARGQTPAATTARLEELQSRIRPHFLFKHPQQRHRAGARGAGQGRDHARRPGRAVPPGAGRPGRVGHAGRRDRAGRALPGDRAARRGAQPRRRQAAHPHRAARQHGGDRGGQQPSAAALGRRAAAARPRHRAGQRARPSAAAARHADAVQRRHGPEKLPGAHCHTRRIIMTTLKTLIVDDEALARSRMRTLLRDCTSPDRRSGGRSLAGRRGAAAARHAGARPGAARRSHARRRRHRGGAHAAQPRRRAGRGVRDGARIACGPGRAERVPLSEVLYLKSEYKYLTVRTATRSHILDGSLNEFEERYPHRFLRVHRNALVARSAIRALEKYDDGEDAEGWALRLDSVPEPVAVSRRQLAARLAGGARGAGQRVLAAVGAGRLHPADAEPAADYALSPLVELLHRWKLPRWIGAGLILMGLFGGLGWTGYSLSGSATQLLDSLPVAAQKLGQAMRRDRGASATPLDNVQQAAAQLEKAAEENSARVASRKGVARVIIERPGFNVRDYLVSGTVGLLSAMGQLTLAKAHQDHRLQPAEEEGHGARAGRHHAQHRALPAGADPGERDRRRRHGLGFWAIGMENAAVWGIIAAVTNLIPYIGSVIVLAAAGLVAFLQFNSLQMGVVVAGMSLGIHTIVGNLLMPWLTSRTSRMNPVAVFVGVIFWGWLWGIWGLLLGIPITMVIKSICDRVEDLQPIGELLGE
ncbi:AI-2E family transporter domain-containing protein [Ditylenchus destructor]|uniref:AI-2E family transporter domain-containing protein n=1 Tax=Ditylenchus destructor TaxID=166010 RepID=A0AAD4QUX5_9BILA|nr:AI-2E family transporter domain-containing protein [Ditylenchus destructor]